MPDQPGRPGEEITRGHPSAQLRAAPNPGDEPPAAGPLAFPAEHDPPRDVVSYGPDIADETTLGASDDASRILSRLIQLEA